MDQRRTRHKPGLESIIGPAPKLGMTQQTRNNQPSLTSWAFFIHNPKATNPAKIHQVRISAFFGPPLAFPDILPILYFHQISHGIKTASPGRYARKIKSGFYQLVCHDTPTLRTAFRQVIFAREPLISAVLAVIHKKFVTCNLM